MSGPGQEDIRSGQHVPLDKLPTGTETILIVDDDPAVVKVTQRIVEQFGYRTLTAHSGREAVEMARRSEEEIHLVILDMVMPVMSGLKALPLLREARPRMRIIVMSGYQTGASPRELLDAGASAFIEKPFHVHTLAAEIRRALDAPAAPSS